MAMPMRQLVTAAFMSALLLWSAATPAADPRYLNLSFENAWPDGTPWLWGRYGPRSPAFEFVVDDAIALDGHRSFRLTRTSAGPDGAAGTVIPASAVAGKTLTVTGALRRQEVPANDAFLWINAALPDGETQSVRSQTSEESTSQDWQTYRVQAAIPMGATDVRFGIGVTAKSGTVWLDALSVAIDGVPYSAPSPRAFEPSQRRTLRREAVALGTGDNLLTTLKPQLEGTRILALGEATHGTHEFLEVRGRILEALAQSGAPILVAFETSMPEARELNEYVNGSGGDVRPILRRLGFWVWNTEEMVRILSLAQSINQRTPGQVQVAGFDCQNPVGAVANVKRLARELDPESLPILERAYGPGLITPDRLPQAREAADYLSQRRETLLRNGDAESVEWGLHNARIVIQALEARTSFDKRELCMADNVRWLRERARPDSLMVLWGHNEHLRKSAYGKATLGYRLAHDFGSAYRSIALSFFSGRYTALQGGRLADISAPTAIGGSLESELHELKLGPEVLLPINAASKLPALRQELLMRSVGATGTDDQFVPLVPIETFDALISIESTTPTRVIMP